MVLSLSNIWKNGSGDAVPVCGNDGSVDRTRLLVHLGDFRFRRSGIPDSTDHSPWLLAGWSGTWSAGMSACLLSVPLRTTSASALTDAIGIICGLVHHSGKTVNVALNECSQADELWIKVDRG